MKTYEWINEKGEVETTDTYNKPPDDKHEWRRIFSFGLSSVNGAGGSPGRPPLRGKKP